MDKRFDELYPPVWSVSFYYRSDAGEMLHGGHWDYQVATAEEATAKFLIDFAKATPGYKSENLELHEPGRDYDPEDVFDYAELLEAENARLQSVVEAVKAYAPVEYQGRIYDTPREWLAVATALAALQAGEG